MTWKIVADSGCDYRQLVSPAIDTTFVSVPLKIQVADQLFVDDANLDIDQMMETMYATSEASKSACPSPDDYLRAFEGGENIIVVSLTGTLSGSHNSAQLAKNIYLEEAISYYKKSLKYITDKTKLILIYKKLARNEATLALTNKDNNKYLMCKSYRHALLYLHKALKLTETKSPVYYNLQLKIISIMRDLGKYNKPLKIYYNAAIKFLKNVQDSNKFSLHYNKIKQDIDKIFIKNKFKYTIQKLLGFNF